MYSLNNYCELWNIKLNAFLCCLWNESAQEMLMAYTLEYYCLNTNFTYSELWESLSTAATKKTVNWGKVLMLQVVSSLLQLHHISRLANCHCSHHSQCVLA